MKRYITAILLYIGGLTTCIAAEPDSMPELTKLSVMDQQLQQYRTELLQLKSEDNPIALDKRLREINDEMSKRYLGRKTNWVFQVTNVKRQGRTIYHVPDLADPATLTVVCATKGIKLNNPNLIVDINISESYAAVFRPNNPRYNHIYVMGSLRRCTLDEDYNPDFIIEDAQAMENDIPFIPDPV